MFILLYYAIILCVIYQICKFSVLYWNSTQLNKRLKFPKAPIANATYFKYFFERIENVQKMHEQCGKIFKVQFFFDTPVFLADPQDVEALLSNKNFLDKPSEYKRIKPILRTGLITSDGELWHKHRRILNKCFTFNVLRQYGEIMRFTMKDMVADIKNILQEDNDINILPHIRKWMALNLYKTLLGVEGEDPQKFVDAVRKIGDVNTNNYGLLSVLPSFIFNYTESGREISNALLTLKTIINSIIADKKEALKNKTDSSKSTSLTDLLVLNDQLSVDELRDEIQTIYVAGLETTALTISYCIHALSRHPEIQDKLYNEINTHLVSDEIPTHETISKLKYLKCVIQETMRTYGAVSAIGRRIHEDLTLPSGNVLLAGVDAYIDLYAIHHDREIYQEPDKFIPERFESEKSLTNAAYLPFSIGPRICIGYKFAMMEMKLTLSILVKKFIFLPADKELKMKKRFLIVPVKGIPVKLKSR